MVRGGARVGRPRGGAALPGWLGSWDGGAQLGLAVNPRKPEGLGADRKGTGRDVLRQAGRQADTERDREGGWPEIGGQGRTGQSKGWDRAWGARVDPGSA